MSNDNEVVGSWVKDRVWCCWRKGHCLPIVDSLIRFGYSESWADMQRRSGTCRGREIGSNNLQLSHKDSVLGDKTTHVCIRL